MKNYVISVFLLIALMMGCVSEHGVATEQPELNTENIGLNLTQFNPDPGNGDVIPVDVLIILDSSCSMDDDRDAIPNLVYLPHDLLMYDEVHWRVGVVPTEINHEVINLDLGVQYPGELLVDIAFDVIGVGSSAERSLDAAVSVLENTDWFRYVFTIFVIITDERDYSTIGPDEFSDYWPTGYDVVGITGINPDPERCGAEHAPDLVEMSTKHIDICESVPWTIF